MAAWTADLCAQWRALGRVRGKRSKVSTTDGKVREDHSLTGRVYRVVWNREKESRQTALDGIQALCERTNDYVASVLSMDPIVPNVMIENCVTHDAGGAATRPSSKSGQSTASQAESEQVHAAQDDMVASVVRRTQQTYFHACDQTTRSNLRDLSAAIDEGCRGMARMIYRTYADDHATVALLLARMNFAQLVRHRIDQSVGKNSVAAASMINTATTTSTASHDDSTSEE